jgi:hypothetical protein
MSIIYSSKGTPVMDFGTYKLVFTSTDKLNDRWKWISISKGTQKIIVPLTLDKLKTSIVPLKVRNRIKKALSKYIKDGYIHKSDLDTIHSELQTVLGESVVTKIDNLMRLLG